MIREDHSASSKVRARMHTLLTLTHLPSNSPSLFYTPEDGICCVVVALVDEFYQFLHPLLASLQGEARMCNLIEATERWSYVSQKS